MRPDCLNHYRILQTLGAGGMGEVYLAEDTKLNRKIAVKVLLGETAADAERRERFAREARAIAAVTHPNIVTVYSVEEDAGRLFLTMEYVNGKPLSESISRGGLPVERVLALAIPLADALAAAHQRGIVHRDLKPANVMVSEEGRVKVLDFGLAKLREEAAEVGQTMTAQITGEGRVLGTAAYMAPEQAEAKTVDARADIFSLGVLLYELATGERPFKGDSPASLISSILRDTPPSVTTIRPGVPRELARIVKRCLQKDPEQRYQTAKDLRNDLQLLKTEIESGEISATDLAPGGAARRRPPRRSLVVATAVVVLAILAAIAYLAFVRLAESPVPFARFTARKITNQGNVAAFPAISPDGTYVAYVTDDNAGETLRLRQLTTGAESVVVATAPAPSHYAGLVFSADGQYVYYVIVNNRASLATRSGGFFRVPFLGGPPTRLIEDVNGMVGLAPDGKRVTFVRADEGRGEQRLIAADIDGGNERVIATATFDHPFNGAPAWSPDGKTIAIPAWKRWQTVVAFPADGGPETVLAEAQEWGASQHLAWTPDGRGLIVAAADKSSGWFFQLWHLSFPAGTVRRITNDANNYGGVSVPRDGSAIVTLQSDWVSSLSIAAASDADHPSSLGVGRGDGVAGVSWAPDGRVVYGTREWDIATIDADGGNQRTLTADEHNNRHPSVSRDGRYIFFTSWRGTNPGAQYRMNIDGGDVRRLTATNAGSGDFPQVTPDGKSLLVVTSVGRRRAIWKVSTEGGERQLFSAEIETPCAISPDGTLVAGMGRDPKTQRLALKVLSFENGTTLKAFDLPAATLVNSGGRGWIAIRWTPDGTGVVYVCRLGNAANLWMQPLAGGEPHQLTNFKSDLIWDFDWSRDNRIVYARGRMNQDVVMISREK